MFVILFLDLFFHPLYHFPVHLLQHFLKHLKFYVLGHVRLGSILQFMTILGVFIANSLEV